MTKHARIHHLLDRIARLRIVLFRYTWSYVHDVDDTFFAAFAGILEAAREELGEARFAAVSVAALRRLIDARARATFVEADISPLPSGDPTGRLLAESRALSERVVSNQFIASMDEVIELYTDQLLASAA